MSDGHRSAALKTGALSVRETVDTGLSAGSAGHSAVIRVVMTDLRSRADHPTRVN